jgi:hypothetical protein
MTGIVSGRTTHAVSRRRRSATGRTTLSSAYENRLIVIAQGIEFNNSELPLDWRTPEYLQAQLGSAIIVSADRKTTRYTSTTQRVRFTIKVTTRKDEFKTYLETEGAHVIYGGHARYGRGPCFGTNPAPGEDWGNGSNPLITGLYRMGYPYLAVPIREILNHQYTCNPVRVTGSRPRSQDCHPDIRAVYSRLRQFTLGDMHPNLHTYLSGIPEPDELVWGFKKRYHGAMRRYVVLHAGWENTASDPMDLNATNLRCRVFCHFGCSTLKHNYRILRFRKNWRRTFTDRFAYWTTGPAYADITHYWLYHILTYPHRTGFRPLKWRNLLQYAVRMTNRDLRLAGRTYQIR